MKKTNETTIGTLVKEPPTYKRKYRQAKYNIPLEEMSIGNALFISKEELHRTLEQEIPLIRQYVYRKAEQLGMKFSVRKFDNDTIDIRRLK
tara:strand:- start:158 stop:430 length:273 start_codon:yes stop_codon:yes gene_type:complete